MPPPTLFCPSCDTLLIPLDEPRLLAACPTCGWGAPAGVEPGQPTRPPIELPLTLLPGLPPCIAPAGLWIAGTHAESGALCHLPWGEKATPGAPLPAPGGWLPRGLALAGETLLFSPDEKEISGPPKALLGLDAHTGEERWRYPVPGFMLTPPAGDPRLACAVDNRGHLIAVDPLNGQERWPPLNLGDFPPQGAPPTLSESLVLVVGPPAGGAGLQAFDRDAGTPLWSFRCPLGAAADYAPSICGDWVYAVAGGRLYALDPITGEAHWHYAAPRQSSQGWFFAPPVAAPGAVLLVSGDYHPQRGPAYTLQALDPQSGELRWRYFLEHSVNLPPVISAGLALLLDRHGTLTALDAATGDLLWQADLDAKPAAPMLAFGGTLYIFTRDNRLHSIALQPPQSAPELAPAEYESRGQWHVAAAAHLLQGEISPAGNALLKDQDAAHALWLFEQIEDRSGQIAALLALQRQDEARKLIPLLADPAARGAAHALLGDHHQAAGEFQQAENWSNAVEQLESLGDAPSLQHAAALAATQLADQPRARRIAHKAGQRFLEAGQPETAWVCFFQAADFTQARKAHQQAVQTAADRYQYGDQAQLLLAWVQAEQVRQGEQAVIGNSMLAEMLHHAADAFGQARDPQRCDECRELAAELLETPRFRLRISTAPEARLIQDHSTRITLQIENIGYGPAKWVRVVVGGNIEQVYTSKFDDLHVGVPQEDPNVHILPTVAGDALLTIDFEYQSYRSGETSQVQIKESIPVEASGFWQQLGKKNVPVQLNIEKFVASGATSTEVHVTDSVLIRSPIGSAVESVETNIQDSMVIRSTLGDAPPSVSPPRVTPLPRLNPGDILCPACKSWNEADAKRCQGCGKSL